MNPKVKEIRPVDIARRLRTESNEAFYSWVRLILTLSTTFLSVLIAFKSNYVPAEPIYLPLLSCGLISFVVTIFSGLVVLHSEVQTKFDSANSIDAILSEYGEQAASENISRRGGKAIARPIYIWSQITFHLSFALAFAFIIAFVVNNL